MVGPHEKKVPRLAICIVLGLLKQVWVGHRYGVIIVVLWEAGQRPLHAFINIEFCR